MTRVWLCDLSGMQADVSAKLESFLPTQEHDRLGRLIRLESCRQKIVSRCLMYVAVGAHVGSGFHCNHISFPVGAAPRYQPGSSEREQLHLSLSHSGPGIAVAVSNSGPIGVDILDDGRPRDWRALATMHFSGAEQAYLAGLADLEARQSFRYLWCLKEALGKATGLPLVDSLATPVLGVVGILETINVSGTSFSLSNARQGPFTLGFAQESCDHIEVTTMTPKKILASLLAAGQQPVNRFPAND